MAVTQKDIDAIYYALRPRLLGLTTVATGGPTTMAPHTHAAEEITFEPALNIGADDVQEGMEELDTENLARDGTQAMLGNLNMNGYQIYNILNLLLTGGLGAAIISAARVITMAGDDDDNEARIQNLERVIFNNEPAKSVIQRPSRVDFNVSVTPGSHYELDEGRLSWSSLEDTLVVCVGSGGLVVTAGTIAAGTVLYAPGVSSIGMPTIASTVTLYPVSLKGSTWNIDMANNFLFSSLEMWSPTVGQIIMPAIAAGTTLYAPGVAHA